MKKVVITGLVAGLSVLGCIAISVGITLFILGAADRTTHDTPPTLVTNPLEPCSVLEQKGVELSMLDLVTYVAETGADPSKAAEDFVREVGDSCPEYLDALSAWGHRNS